MTTSVSFSCRMPLEDRTAPSPKSVPAVMTRYVFENGKARGLSAHFQAALDHQLVHEVAAVVLVVEGPAVFCEEPRYPGGHVVSRSLLRLGVHLEILALRGVRLVVEHELRVAGVQVDGVEDRLDVRVVSLSERVPVELDDERFVFV